MRVQDALKGVDPQLLPNAVEIDKSIGWGVSWCVAAPRGIELTFTTEVHSGFYVPLFLIDSATGVPVYSMSSNSRHSKQVFRRQFKLEEWLWVVRCRQGCSSQREEGGGLPRFFKCERLLVSQWPWQFRKLPRYCEASNPSRVFQSFTRLTDSFSLPTQSGKTGKERDRRIASSLSTSTVKKMVLLSGIVTIPKA